jgi:hypothetical protein
VSASLLAIPYDTFHRTTFTKEHSRSRNNAFIRQDSIFNPSIPLFRVARLQNHPPSDNGRLVRAMNVRQSSFSLAPPGAERRPSVVSRLSSVFSNADQEAGNATSTGAGLIEEEIAEIKRYEVSRMRQTCRLHANQWARTLRQ